MLLVGWYLPSQLQVSEQAMRELRDPVNNGALNEIIASVPNDADAIDVLVNNAVEYIRSLSQSQEEDRSHSRPDNEADVKPHRSDEGEALEGFS